MRVVWQLIAAWWRTLFARLRRGPLRPSWTFTFEWIVRFLRADWDASAEWSPQRLRAHVDGRPYPRKYQRRVVVRDAAIGGVPCRIFTLPDARPGQVLFFHGGSYAYGSARTSHAELLAQLALDCGHEVVGPDFRLAPEHPFPAQLDDALAVIEALGTPRDRLVVAGDSSGGNLVLLLQMALRDRGQPQAKATLLICPWADLSMPGASFQRNADSDFGTHAVLLRQARDVAGELSLTDPRISPVYAKLEGLAPTLVITGTAEIPHDDHLRLIERLRAAGVSITAHIAPEMPHNPPLLAAYHPEAARALSVMADFVRAQLG